MEAAERPGLALLLIAAAWLSTAGASGLFEPTETRYAEIAREMRASGDYLIPHLNGIPHYHKPPLAYWALSAGFAILGENAWGARVPAALAGIATLALVAWIARRRLAPLGIPPALGVWILGSSLLFFVLGRSVATDPFLTASVAAFWALAPSPWALGALGLGFLIKGPVVLVPTALCVLVAAAWSRERGALARLGPAWGWALFVAIAVPWYLIVAARTRGLLSYFLDRQLWERYATETHHRGGPPGYFVAVLLVGALPWTPALLAGLARLWRERTQPEAKLLLCWLLAPLVFFSFSGSKLPAYLLPCFGAMALIAALGSVNAGRAVRWTSAALLAAIAGAGWALGPGLLARMLGLPAGSAAPLAFPAHVGLACLLYAATWMARGWAARAALLVVLGLTSVMVALAPYEAPLGSPRELARVVAANRRAGEPVVEFARFNAGLPFYLGETVKLLEVPRDTELMGRDERARVIITRDSLAALAAAHGRVWLFGPMDANPKLASSLGLRYREIAVWRGKAAGLLSP